MKKIGRPKLEKPLLRKKHSIEAYCTEEEKKKISFYAKNHNFSTSEYIIKKCLDEKVITKRLEMFQELKQVSTEIGKAGNNISQLAHHANRVIKTKEIDQNIIEMFNSLLENYVKQLDQVKISIKGIYREMAK